MKKPESTLSYDRCVPVFCCFVAAFYFADALILLTPFIPPLPSFHSCLPVNVRDKMVCLSEQKQSYLNRVL